MSVVSDLYTFLEAQGITGGATGWTALRRRLMDDPAPDQVVVITEDGGPAPEIQSAEGIGDSALKDLGVQVRVRAAAWKGDTAQAKAMEIFTALHGKRGITVGATTYTRVRAMTPEPVFNRFDSVGRPEFTQSFRMLTTV